MSRSLKVLVGACISAASGLVPLARADQAASTVVAPSAQMTLTQPQYNAVAPAQRPLAARRNARG